MCGAKFSVAARSREGRGETQGNSASRNSSAAQLPAITTIRPTSGTHHPSQQHCRPRLGLVLCSSSPLHTWRPEGKTRLEENRDPTSSNGEIKRKTLQKRGKARPRQYYHSEPQWLPQGRPGDHWKREIKTLGEKKKNKSSEDIYASIKVRPTSSVQVKYILCTIKSNSHLTSNHNLKCYIFFTRWKNWNEYKIFWDFVVVELNYIFTQLNLVIF